MSGGDEHKTRTSHYDVPEPGEWMAVDRNQLGTKYEHSDGTVAKTSSDGPNSASFTIDGEEVFALTNTRSDMSRFWDKVEAALEGYPDNVEAHNRVGNAGLGEFQ